MNRNRVLAFVGAVAAIAGLALGLVFGLALDGSREEAATGPVARSSGGPSEGIKVHGHWVLEVRDPDGTLVSRREFDNALESEGGESLAMFLAREVSVGLWRVKVEGTPDGFCEDNESFREDCLIVESEASANDAEESNTLAVNESNGDLVLTGSTTAVYDGEIATVSTEVRRCASGNIGCHFGTSKSFSSVDVDPDQPVLEGQSIEITVTISFE